MLSNLLLVAGQVGTLFLMMAVGFVLAKLKKLTPEAVPQISFLLLYVVVPCVVVNALQTDKDPALLRELGVCALVVAVSYVVYALLVLPFFRRRPEGTRASLQFGVVYGNTGFMGLPLVQAVFGNDALIYASVAFVVFMLFNWTHGVIVMGGRKNFSLKTAIINPGVLGSVVGLALFLGGIRLPSLVGNAVSFLANVNTPLAMVVIGAQMAWADLPATFRRPLLYQAAALKLVVIPLITAVAILPLHLSPLLYCTIVILSAAPTAGVTSMFAVRYGRDAESAAQVITLTTLLSIITLPIFGVLATAWS